MRNDGRVTAISIGSLPLSLDISVDAPTWMLTSEPMRCLEVEDPDLFFPDDYGLRNKDQIEEARRECHKCPAYDACLEWATGVPSLEGIWAATTPPERRRLRNQGTTATSTAVA